MKISNSAAETFELLYETFGELSSSRTAVFNGIHISRSIECQLKMTHVEGY
jgi:hypothetical protein